MRPKTHFLKRCLWGPHQLGLKDKNCNWRRALDIADEQLELKRDRVTDGLEATDAPYEWLKHQ